MTYLVGRRVTLSTEVRNLAGALADTTMALTMTKPDGTTLTPAPTITHPSLGVYSADVTLDTPGDWLRLWTGTGAVEVTDVDQLHVIAAALRIVGLAEVKEHGNITSASSDAELLDFIGTAQQMIESLVGATVPRTVTEIRHQGNPLRSRAHGPAVLWLNEGPILSVTSVTEYGALVDPSLYLVDVNDATITRKDCRSWYGDQVFPFTVVYRVGRVPIDEGIRWAAKELTISLWRSTQTQRGGAGRGGDTPATPTGYGMPNRVREALEPFLLIPAVS